MAVIYLCSESLCVKEAAFRVRLPARSMSFLCREHAKTLRERAALENVDLDDVLQPVVKDIP
jgi:hypothetical protein